MADLDNQDIGLEPEVDQVDLQDDQVPNEPAPQPSLPPTPAAPTPLEQRLIDSEMQSQALIRQMVQMNSRQAQAPAAPPAPVIPADILEGATPIVRAVLGPQLQEIENMKQTLSGIINQRSADVEKTFILGQVPDWDEVKGDVATHIHQQLDQLGVDRDPEVRRQYFTPVSVVTAANFLKAQRGNQAPPQPNPTLATRSVVEGRGTGTSPAALPATVDYSKMSDAEFSKREAQIAAARMRRNSG